jgi:hypothetical protein
MRKMVGVTGLSISTLEWLLGLKSRECENLGGFDAGLGPGIGIEGVE